MKEGYSPHPVSPKPPDIIEGFEGTLEAEAEPGEEGLHGSRDLPFCEERNRHVSCHTGKARQQSMQNTGNMLLSQKAMQSVWSRCSTSWT